MQPTTHTKIAFLSLLGSLLPFNVLAQESAAETSLTHELQELVVTADQNLFKTKGPNKFVYEVYKDSTLINANTLDALARVPCHLYTYPSPRD